MVSFFEAKISGLTTKLALSTSNWIVSPWWACWWKPCDDMAAEDVDALLDDEDEWAFPILGVKLIFSKGKVLVGLEWAVSMSTEDQLHNYEWCLRVCSPLGPEEHDDWMSVQSLVSLRAASHFGGQMIKFIQVKRTSRGTKWEEGEDKALAQWLLLLLMLFLCW